MKIATLSIVFSVGMLFILATGIQSGQGSGLKDEPIASTTLPDSINKIVQKSCIACHSNEGGGMAKMHVNFDIWDSYGEKKQLSKAKDICEELTKAKMPPKGYRENNPESVPTDKEIKTICAWAESFQE